MLKEIPGCSRVYGIPGGLKEACEAYPAQLEQTTRGRKVLDLIEDYEKTRSSGWSDKYKANWKWFRGLLAPIEATPIVSADSNYEQHYRNAGSPQEAERFWGIVPPGQGSLQCLS